MTLPRNLFLVAAGAVGGILFILSCGDDSPVDVDAAAVCDCPAAEAPITADRLEIIDSQVTIPANGSATEAGGCELPAILLHGGCLLLGANPDVSLQQGGPDVDQTNIYNCFWNNAGPTPTTGIIRAVCLNPAD